MKTTYIFQLPQATQNEIKNDLLQAGIDLQDIEIALDGRLSDLEDTIDINKYL